MFDSRLRYTEQCFGETHNARYTTHAPIRINSDTQFTSANGVVSGSGTESDPYIIEGWEINGNGGASCIWIENTNAYFIVRNCCVYGATNSGSPPYGAGIALNNVTNGTLENNKCNNSRYGIYVYGGSSNNNVTNNNASGNSYYGIYLKYSRSNISSNNASGNSHYGVYLYYSNNNLVSHNTAMGNGEYGLYFYYSNNNHLVNNTASSNSQYGIYLLSSNNNNITKNIALTNERGICLWESDYNNLTGNNVSGNRDGVYLISSNVNIVCYNWFSNNINYGAYITNASSKNTIAYNNFIGNNGGGPDCQAYDNVGSNSWNLTSPKEGNYWDNWDGQDWGTASAYPLDGGKGASDWYPLYSPVPQNPPPIASFAANTTNGTAPLAVSFTSTSTDPDGYIASYLWDFGEGNTSTQENPNYTFTLPGNYTVKLTVRDNDGLNASANLTIRVLALPITSFTTNITSGIAPLAIQFTSTSSDPDGTIVSYHWDFGDGNTSTVPSPNHTFIQPGNYTVKLTVVDNDGLSANSAILITVSGSSSIQQDTASPQEEGSSPFPWLMGVLAVIAVCWMVALRRKRRV
ncbi:MAG: PKD domain-containing protein [Thermoplasmata archaeon]